MTFLLRPGQHNCDQTCLHIHPAHKCAYVIWLLIYILSVSECEDKLKPHLLAVVFGNTNCKPWPFLRCKTDRLMIAIYIYLHCCCISSPCKKETYIQKRDQKLLLLPPPTPPPHPFRPFRQEVYTSLLSKSHSPT